MATEQRLRRWLLPRVYEHRSSLETLGDPLCVLDIIAPDAGTETSQRAIGTLDDLLLVRPWLSWHNWSERLFLDDTAVVWRVIDDSWLDEETLAVADVCRTNGELVALVFGILEHVLDLLVLHLVLDGSKERARLWVADLDGLGELNHGLEHLIVDTLVDVDTLGGDADLSGVLEGAHYELWSNLLHVNIGKDDGGIITAELESDTLERWGTGCHDLLAGCDGAGERDLGDAWVACEHWAESIRAANDLDETWVGDLLDELDDLETCVWSVWRWLADDGVTGEKCWNDLSKREDDWEVPFHESVYEYLRWFEGTHME
jgi:hypothetical protein